MAVPLKYSIRNLWVRKISTGLTIVGIVLVITIFVAVLALLHGLEVTMVSTASPDNIVILASGAQSETTSKLSRDVAPLVRVRQEIRVAPEPLVSEEMVDSVVLDLGEKRALSSELSIQAGRRITARGVTPIAVKVHERFKLTQGQMFQPRVGEVIVGTALAKDLPMLQIGKTINFYNRSWKISGIFEAGKTSFESELWLDQGELMEAAHAKAVSSITVKLNNAAQAGDVCAQLVADPRLQVKAVPETDYYTEQNKIADKMKGFGYFIAVIMSLGAIFGAMNTLYASLSERIREVATLRALGFSQASILTAFISESLFMSLTGGLAGCMLALLMNGYSMSLMDFNRFVSVAFEFHVTPGIIGAAMIFAGLMGLLGGLLPAMRAARLPVIQALRAL